jgi:hypothetical protein
MEEVKLDLNVRTPVEPGNYILELDMVQEMVSWFKDKGSPTIKLPVQVEEDNRTIATNIDMTIPIMEMHTVSKDIVLELIASNGGEIVDVKQDTSAGPSWLSFTYYAKKKF